MVYRFVARRRRPPSKQAGLVVSKAWMGVLASVVRITRARSASDEDRTRRLPIHQAYAPRPLEGALARRDWGRRLPWHRLVISATLDLSKCDPDSAVASTSKVIASNIRTTPQPGYHPCSALGFTKAEPRECDNQGRAYY